MRKIFVISLVLSLFFINLNLSAVQTKKPDFSKMPKYENLLKKLKKGNKEISFFDLRMSFTRTKDYKSANPELDSVRKKMVQELNSKEYKKAIFYADSVLKQEYVDMYSHYVCYYAYTALGDSVKASWHEFMMDRLLNSIVESGDGSTKESALLVITTNEEYFFLFIYKMKVNDRTITNFNGEPIDIFKVTDPATKDSFDLYFNTYLMIEEQNK